MTKQVKTFNRGYEAPPKLNGLRGNRLFRGAVFPVALLTNTRAVGKEIEYQTIHSLPYPLSPPLPLLRAQMPTAAFFGCFKVKWLKANLINYGPYIGKSGTHTSRHAKLGITIKATGMEDIGFSLAVLIHARCRL